MNINWKEGGITLGEWVKIRDFVRGNKIKEVLAFGTDLEEELFVLEGVVVTPGHALESFPGKTWNMAFIDGAKECASEILSAMLRSTHYVYLLHAGENDLGLLSNHSDWIELFPGVFKRNRVANHHGQVLELLKDHFGDLPAVGMEIGTHYADLTKAILRECPNIRLYTVDPWLHQEGNLFEAARPQEDMDAMKAHAYHALEEFGSRVAIMPMLSDAAYGEIDEPLDFVWIDGDHTIETVIRDIESALPRIKPGGILGGHDYATVEAAVHKVLAGIEIFTGHDLTWWAYV